MLIFLATDENGFGIVPVVEDAMSLVRNCIAVLFKQDDPK